MDVMVDIETLGTRPGCVVLTVGACTMERNPEDRQTLILALDWGEQVQAGRTIDAGTLAWWNRQSASARDAAFGGTQRLSTEEFTKYFGAFWTSTGAQRIWCHGATFDAPILESLTPAPWKFWNIRDTRTLYALAGVSPKRGGDHHHALADAMSQTNAVWAALDTLNLNELPNH